MHLLLLVINKGTTQLNIEQLQSNDRIYVTTNENKKIHVRLWNQGSGGSPIVLVHGMCEHSGHYEDFAIRLSRELECPTVAFDLPSHGLSYGRPGDIANFSDLGEALGTVTREIFSKRRDIRLFCHSMGGLVGLDYIIKNDNYK